MNRRGRAQPIGPIRHNRGRCLRGVAFVAGPVPPLLRAKPRATAPPAPITAVDPGAGLPFSTAELEQALLARLSPADARPRRVEGRARRRRRVTIQVGDRSRVVTIGERTGPAAARIVALVIAELLSDDADAAQADGGGRAAAVTVARWPMSRAPVRPHRIGRPRRPSPPPRLCFTGGATKGMGTEELRGHARRRRRPAIRRPGAGRAVGWGWS